MREKTLALIMSGVAALTLGVAVAGTARAAEPTAAGLWLNSDENGRADGWFLIGERNGLYEGVIARMFQKPGDDPNPLCTKCVDDRKNMPWLGIPLIRDMKRTGLEYKGGNILDPRDGKIYRALMELSSDGETLRVRGFYGIELFGENQTWKRLPETAMKDVDPSVRARYASASPAPPPVRPNPTPPQRAPAPKQNQK